MNRRHPRRPSLIQCQTTTTQILKQTNTIIFSKRHHFFISLILSFLLFSFQTSAQTIIRSLTSSIDNDPFLKTYYHQLRNPLNPFIFDQEIDLRYFRNARPEPQPNATTLILSSFNTQMGFSGFISDNGIKGSEVVHPGLKFSFRSTEKHENESSTTHDDGDDKKINPWFLGTAYIATYALENIGFNFTQSCAHAIIFVLMVNHFMKTGHNQSLIMVCRKGAYLGFKRLTFFNEIRWVIRALFTRLLTKLFFGHIKDPYTSYKYMVKLIFMPYSQRLIWMEGFEKETYGFLYSWFLLEMLLSCVFTVFASVCMADRAYSDWEVTKEGFCLLSLRKRPAILLMSLEYIVWRFVAAILRGIFGELFASCMQSFMEVYFMVAWIIYYFAVMSVYANSRGITFGRRAELQGMLIQIW